MRQAPIVPYQSELLPGAALSQVVRIRSSTRRGEKGKCARGFNVARPCRGGLPDLNKAGEIRLRYQIPAILKTRGASGRSPPGLYLSHQKWGESNIFARFGNLDNSPDCPYSAQYNAQNRCPTTSSGNGEVPDLRPVCLLQYPAPGTPKP